MIINFRHKGLQHYYEEGKGPKLPAAYLRKITRILDQLDAVTSMSDIQQMGSGIHKLTGNIAVFGLSVLLLTIVLFSDLRMETYKMSIISTTINKQ